MYEELNLSIKEALLSTSILLQAINIDKQNEDVQNMN